MQYFISPTPCFLALTTSFLANLRRGGLYPEVPTTCPLPVPSRTLPYPPTCHDVGYHEEQHDPQIWQRLLDAAVESVLSVEELWVSMTSPQGEVVTYLEIPASPRCRWQVWKGGVVIYLRVRTSPPPIHRG